MAKLLDYIQLGHCNYSPEQFEDALFLFARRQHYISTNFDPGAHETCSDQRHILALNEIVEAAPLSISCGFDTVDGRFVSK